MIWPDPDRILEAGEDSPARRAQRANRAAQDVIRDYQKVEQGTVDQLATRLAALKQSLLSRLAGENLTDFKAMTLNRLLADVDQLIADTGVKVIGDTERPYAKANELGDQAATEPMKAAQLSISKALPGLDSVLVQAAFGNTVDLLTAPMQQFASQVKTGIRRVALAGDNKFEEIQRLTGLIKGQGMDAAQYKAERIIRTELGRVFNQATFEKLSALAKDFPFLGKGWRATKDRRTRTGHVQAGRDYARGRGIPMSAQFRVNVYDERDRKKAPVLIGVASLRFPSDPQATPAGKVAAGATIMCRCNAFVDVDVAKFAAFTKAKVATAMGGAEPPPTPRPAPPVNVIPKPVKAPRIPKPKPLKVPKVATITKMPVGIPAAKVADPTLIGPKGTKVGPKLAIPNSPQYAEVQAAMNVIDTVHGDGPLNPIKFSPDSGKNFGQLTSMDGRGTTTLAVGYAGRTAHPRMTTWHETGHWLDFMSLGKGGAVHPGTQETIRYISKKAGRYAAIVTDVVPTKAPSPVPGHTGIADWTTEDKKNPLVAEWRKAVNASAAIAKIKEFKAPGQPYGIKKHAKYLLEGKEMFARSYAQWIATRSNDPVGMAELRKYQAPDPGQHEIGRSRQWSDEDFKPIGEALDRLFEKQGWRGKP